LQAPSASSNGRRKYPPNKGRPHGTRSSAFAQAKTMATLNDVLARNAKRMKIKPLDF
jgi:hypothetical protein